MLHACLRGLPLRLVAEAARRHDQSIKVACAATLGFIDLNTLPAGQKLQLHGVMDTDLPPDFVEAYRQVCLDVGVGGHGLRTWAGHTTVRPRRTTLTATLIYIIGARPSSAQPG